MFSFKKAKYWNLIPFWDIFRGQVFGRFQPKVAPDYKVHHLFTVSNLGKALG